MLLLYFVFDSRLAKLGYTSFFMGSEASRLKMATAWPKSLERGLTTK